MANEFRMQSSEMVRTLAKNETSKAATLAPIVLHEQTGMLKPASLQLLPSMPTCVACKEFPINFNWHAINIVA